MQEKKEKTYLIVIYFQSDSIKK